MPVIRQRKPTSKSWATVAQIRANRDAADPSADPVEPLKRPEVAVVLSDDPVVPQVRMTPPAPDEATTDAEQKPATHKEKTHGTSR